MAQYDVVVKAVDQTKTAFRGVENGLKSIQSRAEEANRVIAKMQGQIQDLASKGTVAFAAVTGTALRFADAVQDASEATNISTARILAFSQGVASSGGEASKAIDGLTRFGQTIGEAAAGSTAARDAFDKVGVSLTDLRKLSEEDLLGKVVAGLGNIDDASTRAAIQADLFGKSLKGVNITGFAADLENATAAQRANAEAIKSGAQLVDTLKNAYNRLEIQILKAIKPLADWVNAASPEQIDRLIKAIVDLGVAIVGLTVGLKVLEALAALNALVAASFTKIVGGAKALWTVFTEAGAIIGNLLRPLLAVTNTITLTGEAAVAAGAGIRLAFGPTILSALGAIGAGLGNLIVIAGSAALAIDALFDTKIIESFISGTKRAYNAVKDFLGFGEKPIQLNSTAGAGRGGSDAITKQLQQRGEELAKAARADREIVDNELKALQDSINKARKEYSTFLPLLSSKDPAIAAAALEKVNAAAKTLQITLSDDIILRNFNARLKEQADQLRQQQLIYSDTTRILAENNIELSKQELELRKSATTLGDAATQQRVFNIELEKSRQATQQQVTNLQLTVEAYNNGRISLTDYLKTLQGVDAALLSAEQRQLMFNDAISRGLNEAATNAELAGKAMADAYAAGDMERFVAVYEQYKNVLGSTATGELAVARKGAREELQLTRDRAAALKTLTEEYKKNGGTGSAEYRKVAEALGMSTEAIDRMVNIHGSAIDRMVEDARFYENSIQNAANTFSSEFTRAFMEGRNTLDSFRNFFSNIANDIANRIIKQQLADPIADALSGIAGKIIGGFGGGSGSGGGFFSSIISGVGGFLGDIFGGFFADGGTLGAGQFGIVGEEGPELITGPANITPMKDMNGRDDNLQVVFQIQAIDTQTGAQFLLQNKPLITSMITQAYNSRGRRGPLD